MQVIVSNLLVQYERAGEGKQVLLLHGWGDNSKTFNKLNQTLAKHYEIIAPDLAGFGGSEASESAWSLDDYAEHIAVFLKKIDAQPFAIIGHSNGGAIATRGLGKSILSAEKLILLAASGIRNEYDAKQKSLRALARVAKLISRPLPEDTREKIKRSAYKKMGSDQFVIEHMQDTFRRIVTDDVRVDCNSILADTLLIYGDKDDATPVSYARIFAERIKNSKLEIINNVGHFLHHEAPEQTEQLIYDFLQDKA